MLQLTSECSVGSKSPSKILSRQLFPTSIGVLKLLPKVIFIISPLSSQMSQMPVLPLCCLLFSGNMAELHPIQSISLLRRLAFTHNLGFFLRLKHNSSIKRYENENFCYKNTSERQKKKLHLPELEYYRLWIRSFSEEGNQVKWKILLHIHEKSNTQRSEMEKQQNHLPRVCKIQSLD